MLNFVLDRFNKQDNREIEKRGEYSFYVYDAQQVVSWSDNRFVPSQASVAEPFTVKLLKAGNGDYLAKKWKVNDSRIFSLP